MAGKRKKRDICEGCGADLEKEQWINLVDGKICARCAEALRIKYPLEYQKNLFWDMEGEPLYLVKDPLEDLRIKDFLEELDAIDGYREQVRCSYGGAENVFEIRLAMPMPELNPFRVNIPNAARYNGSTVTYGWVRLGSLHMGDLVEVQHGEEILDATVLALRRCHIMEVDDPLWQYRKPDSDDLFHFEKNGVKEGYSAILILSGEAVHAEPGDFVFSD